MLTKNKLLKQKCTGCFACINICPRKAINMKLNNEGFFYPNVDKEKCNNCNLCLKVCPAINNQINTNISPKNVIAAKSLNKETQISSSSGGIFTELAKAIIKQKGVVFGVVFDKKIAKHIFIDKIDDLKKIRGSKYLQSYVNNSFKEVKKFLNLNKLVLFSGTPCQIAGLKSFLNLKKINTKNLFLIDVVCHGVPSYRIFKEHILNISSSKGKILINIRFRDKKLGWKFFSLKYEFEDRLKNKFVIDNEHQKDFFMRGYLKNYYLRKSCYDCKFSKIPRQGDITLGDFWGIPKKYYDRNGVSLVLLNNKKGDELFKKVENNISHDILNSNVISSNSRLVLGKYKQNHYNKRKEFFEDYFNKDYNFCKRKYLKLGVSDIFINLLKKIKWRILK